MADIFLKDKKTFRNWAEYLADIRWGSKGPYIAKNNTPLGPIRKLWHVWQYVF